MIKILRDEDGPERGWQLVNGTASGADVLARSTDDAGDGMSALTALVAYDAPVHVVGAPDGHWKWILTGPAGEVTAESPAVYPDADRCREAFVDAQRAARAVLGKPAAPNARSERPQNG